MYPYKDYKIKEIISNSEGISVDVVFNEGQYEDEEILEYDPSTDTETVKTVSIYKRIGSHTGGFSHIFPVGTTNDEIIISINEIFDVDTERTSIWA